MVNQAHFRVAAKTFLPVGWIKYSSSEAAPQRQALLETVLFLCVYNFIVYLIWGAVLGFVAACAFSVLVVSGCCSAARRPSLQGRLIAEHGLYSTGSVVMVHGLGCSSTCGIFWHQGSNPCLLHWQADSLPLSHQGGLVFFLDKVLLGHSHAHSFFWL